MAKILFIEDESALQRAATKVLNEEGYSVLSALNGEDGLEMAKREKPDLILLDLILPKLDGFAVLEALKQDDTTKKIPVMILSNLEGGGDVEQALELGAKTYLVKANYRLEEVVEKIKQVLGNSQ
ncbi:MAG: response regulator [Candidatus Sungiibacteriota bacterium]|uniref:Response regulator n=1 Tax=Candidatus Sungiibacteriota bacterium TaxID=2750080 RepID=A0A7T5RK85_9BACT|nr:MAG: response regulator [Candidatus Sungbacteria bacterium]